MLKNFLSNACDAIQELDEKWIKLSLVSEKNFVRIIISDSGQGITEEISNKLMETFYTTKELGKGTGLGLIVSLGIAQEHCGSLFLDQTSKNTTFVIELPPKHTRCQKNKKVA